MFAIVEGNRSACDLTLRKLFSAVCHLIIR